MPSVFQRIAALCSLALVLQVAGLLFFVSGFFPVKPALNGMSDARSFAPGCGVEQSEVLNPGPKSGGDEDGSGVPPQFDRVVFMVIDGLPAEFILGKGEGPKPVELMAAMPYTQMLLATGAALGFHAKAASPTVTMPRLKAMTSGAIAGFLDVAYNLNTQALLDDNWIAQAARAGWRMVMLGDNTWLKLFPNVFERHDGVHSFFVKDTVEVDYNVTRHLDAELLRDDWDLLVLHYLGLDHVGHLGGRSSPLMVPKLAEMDAVIARIHKSVLREGCSSRRPLLVVVSDHGMTGSGNHGGGSAQETDALALFVKDFGCNAPAPTEADPSSPGRKTSATYQVDVVPTMSLLVGLPIPKNSVGSLLPSMFSTLTFEQQTRALELNSWQLLRLVSARYPSSTCIQEICQNRQADSNVKSVHNNSSSDKSGLFCNMFRSALNLHQQWRHRSEDSVSHADKINEPTFDMVRETYLEFLKHTSEWLARASTEKRFSFILTGSTLILISTLTFLVSLFKTQKRISIEFALRSGQLIRPVSLAFVPLIAIGGVCAHAGSLGSSSFVEEEQYTWHFLVSTFLLVLIRKALQEMGQIGQALSTHGLCMTKKGILKQVLRLCLLLVVGRTQRSWHRSGVNWAHLPDVAKFLDSGNPAKLTVLRVACLCSVTLLCCKMISESLPKILRTFVAVCLTISGGIIFMYMRFSSVQRQDFWATLVARIGFAVLGATSLISCFIVPWAVSLRKPFNLIPNDKPGLATLDRVVDVAMDSTGQVLISCWCLLQLLLQQPVNSGPILLLLVQLLLTSNFFWNLPRSNNRWISILVFHWLGNLGHFGLGNSNTLATVDVAGAYIGLTSHSTVLSGILAFIITYGSPLLYMQALLLLKSSSLSTLEGRTSFSELWLVESLALPVVIPLALNSVVLLVFTGVLVTQQHHLFVWSVFSPKYLYVCMTTVSLYIGILLVVTIQGYSSLVVSRRMHWTQA